MGELLTRGELQSIRKTPTGKTRLITDEDEIWGVTGQWPGKNPRPICGKCLQRTHVAKTDSGSQKKGQKRRKEVGQWCQKGRKFFIKRVDSRGKSKGYVLHIKRRSSRLVQDREEIAAKTGRWVGPTARPRCGKCLDELDPENEERQPTTTQTVYAGGEEIGQFCPRHREFFEQVIVKVEVKKYA